MKSKKDVVINIKPFDADLELTSRGFVITFVATMADDYSRRKKVKVHLENYWVQYLAGMLWKVQNGQQATANEMKKALHGG